MRPGFLFANFLNFMIALIQRVSECHVLVNNTVTGKISKGLLVLLGITHADTEVEVDKLVKKIVQLRIFNDEDKKMNLSVQDIGGEILVVSQFTLYGDYKKGNRPSYIEAARPEKAIPLYEKFILSVSEALGKPVATGIFGAMMDVHLVNEGPVTIHLDTSRL